MDGAGWLLALSSETDLARRKLLDCANASHQWAFVFLGLAVGLMLGIVCTWLHTKQQLWAPSKHIKQQHTRAYTKYSMFGMGLPMMDDSMVTNSAATQATMEAQPANHEEINVLVHSTHSTPPTETYGIPLPGTDFVNKEGHDGSVTVASYGAAAVMVNVVSKSDNKCDVQLKQTISDEGYAMWLTPPHDASTISSPTSTCISPQHQMSPTSTPEQQAGPPSATHANSCVLFRSRDMLHATEHKAHSSNYFRINSPSEIAPDKPSISFAAPRSTPNFLFGRKSAPLVKGIHESRALAFSLRKFPAETRRMTSCPNAALTAASPNSSIEICLSH